MSAERAWYEIDNAAEIASPALLVYPERVEENIRRTVAIAGSAARLRPHIKTHKMAEVLSLQLAAGIDKFKCATLAECELAARVGAGDVLYAFQPVGPNLAILTKLVAAFPQTRFSALVDNERSLREIDDAGVSLGLVVDLDVGMHRSGIAPDERAEALYQQLAAARHVYPAGLHVYDGHVKTHDVAERERITNEAYAPAEHLRRRLIERGFDVPQVVAGGSPTFAIHARHPDRQASPGTSVFWDAAYATKFPELDFLHAALVLGRVVSKPTPEVLCLDLGYKSISPDNANPRVVFPRLPDAEMLVHSEEHLAIKTAGAKDFAVGACLYGIPWHICPTVALHREAIVVRGGRAVDRWRVAARDRDVSV